MYGLGDVEDGLGVVDVSLEGCLAQQEVVQDEPGDGLGLFHVEAELRADPCRDLGAQDGVVAAAAFGYVVQEHGHVEGAAGLQVLDEAAGDRGYVG